MSSTRRNAVLLVLLLFAQLVLMAGSARNAGGATLLESWTSSASSPVVGLAGAVGGAFDDLVSGTRNLFRAHRRNRTLERELADLRADLRRAREAEAENARLRRLLDMRRDLVPEAIGATVVTAHLDDRTRMIVVDRGARDGVRVDLPVVGWGGAVGRVVRVAPHHATVQLLTDPGSGVAGIVQRSRAQGMVVGRTDGFLDLLYVPTFSDVGHGDRVVTSGLDGIFPRGFGLGRVISVEAVPDGSQRIRLEPELDFGGLEEVLILREPGGGAMPPEPGQPAESAP